MATKKYVDNMRFFWSFERENDLFRPLPRDSYRQIDGRELIEIMQ